MGYELVGLAQQSLTSAELFFEQELKPFFKKYYDFESSFFNYQLSDNIFKQLKHRIEFVEESIEIFREEEEIVALEVKDWEIVEKFTL